MCISCIFSNKETKTTLWQQEQNTGSSFQASGLISRTLIVCQCRLSTAATVICRSPSDGLIFLSTFYKNALNDSANVRTRRQKRPDISFPSSCWWPAFSSKDGIEEPIGCVLWSTFEFPRLFQPGLPRLQPPAPLQVPPLYYMLQHRCQHCFLWWMSLCSQPIYLASLLCALVDRITFHFLRCADQKGHLRSWGKKSLSEQRQKNLGI